MISQWFGDTRRVARAVLEETASAARRLARESRSYVVVSILSLGIGIGANSAIYGLADQLLFRAPDHVRAPEEVVRLRNVRNYAQYLSLARDARLVEATAYT